MNELSKDEIDILRHSLGVSVDKSPYRNYFCTGPGTTDFPVVSRLVELGFMGVIILPGSRPEYYAENGLFCVTQFGAAAIGMELSK
jgi:hypothetical protein